MWQVYIRAWIFLCPKTKMFFTFMTLHLKKNIVGGEFHTQQQFFSMNKLPPEQNVWLVLSILKPHKMAFIFVIDLQETINSLVLMWNLDSDIAIHILFYSSIFRIKLYNDNKKFHPNHLARTALYGSHKDFICITRTTERRASNSNMIWHGDKIIELKIKITN